MREGQYYNHRGFKDVYIYVVSALGDDTYKVLYYNRNYNKLCVDKLDTVIIRRPEEFTEVTSELR
jgi:hypothetical protein